MNRTAIFFLLVIAPVFAIVLALLGVESIPANPLGWFLLLVGVSYPVGVVIVVWIRKRPFWESGSGGSVVKEERNDRSYWILVLGMLVVFYLSPLEYLFVPAIIPRASGFILAGLLLVIAGAALFVWARRSLRQAYSGHISVTTQQPLVQRGPYRLIRHPAYAGYLLMAAGLGVGYSSLSGLAAGFLLLLPGLIYRIGVEEKVLLAHFGEQYRLYASHTTRLIPGIW
jgi:protein-S-isoprenylcysteine O-methyltransferase Ste14